MVSVFFFSFTKKIIDLGHQKIIHYSISQNVIDFMNVKTCKNIRHCLEAVLPDSGSLQQTSGRFHQNGGRFLQWPFTLGSVFTRYRQG